MSNPFKLMTRGEVGFQVFAIVFVTLLCLTTLYPFIHVLSISLSAPAEAVRPGVYLYPKDFTPDAYVHAAKLGGIWSGFGNSLYRTVLGTFLSLFVMAMAAYALSKKYLPHRSMITLLVVVTMFFSGGLIPSFLLVKSIGLYDTRWALILPGLFNTFYMLIMRNFFMSIPNELEESAKMDGANDWRILFQLILPLSKPILATVSLWVAVNHWNEWFHALIYIQDQDKVVLQIYLRRLVLENLDHDVRQLMEQADGGFSQVIPETIKAAVLMIATVPILLIFPFIQKYFVRGIMLGSVKG